MEDPLYRDGLDAKIKINNHLKRRECMYGQERVYKKVEVIGISKNSIEDAIQSAVNTAHKSLEKLSWFEVGDIRGHVGEDGTVTEYQVDLKVAFQLKKK
jgi:flavin-binding protein dodecin